LAGVLPPLAGCFELAISLVKDHLGQPIQLVSRRDIADGAIQTNVVGLAIKAKAEVDRRAGRRDRLFDPQMAMLRQCNDS
jgi:hypothetical protein